MDKCPFGLKLIGIINLIWGIYYSFNFSYRTNEILAAIVAVLLFAVVPVWVSIAAIFTSKRWAFTASRIIAGFGLMITLGVYGVQTHDLVLITNLQRKLFLMWGCAIAVVYFILVLFYLNRPKIKERFK